MKKMYTPVNPFYYIKVGCKGVYITRTCLHDGVYDHRGIALVLPELSTEPIIPAKTCCQPSPSTAV